MSSGQVLKAEKDFTNEVDKLLPEAEKLGEVLYLDSQVFRRLTDL